jgi:hypothetical protein
VNRADGISEIEGKAARAAASEQGRTRVSNSCLESVFEKNLNSDDHFDPPFSFMAMKGNYRIRKEMDKTLAEKTARASRFP